MVLSFWSSEHLKSFNGIAIANKDLSISYPILNKMVSDYTEFLCMYNLKHQLAFLPMNSDIYSVVKYLACLRLSIVPLLIPINLNRKLLQNLKLIYDPAFSFKINEYKNIELHAKSKLDSKYPKELSLLLSTSGSTGSVKLVKLSDMNLKGNAKSIKDYLHIKTDDKAHCTLPLSYSYGLSVLNSHLQSGACVFLSDLNPFSIDYYQELIKEKITSISGVPLFYQMLLRTGFLEKEIPSLKVMTQAGGRLTNKFIKRFNDYACNKNINFYIMYGQTEATARISYVPPEMLGKKIGSIGIAIPEGKLALSDDGEIIYTGPNVMMGYAKNRNDLLKNGPYLEKLLTGDIGKKDSDGFYYITGRLNRFLKLAGSRYGLDEIETFLEETFDAFFLATGKDDNLVIIFSNFDGPHEKIINNLQEKFSINRSYIKIKEVKDIVRKTNGKKDYSYYWREFSED